MVPGGLEYLIFRDSGISSTNIFEHGNGRGAQGPPGSGPPQESVRALLGEDADEDRAPDSLGRIRVGVSCAGDSYMGGFSNLGTFDLSMNFKEQVSQCLSLPARLQQLFHEIHLKAPNQ